MFVESTGKQEALKARETNSNRMEAPWELRVLQLTENPVLEFVLSAFTRSCTVLQTSALLVTVRHQSCVRARA